MKNFARGRPLTDISGLADYITDEKRQEMILLKSAPVDWKPFAEFERQRVDYISPEDAEKMSVNPTYDGRELTITLPNQWKYQLDRGEMTMEQFTENVDSIVKVALGDTVCQYAVHFNKADSEKVLAKDKTKDVTNIFTGKKEKKVVKEGEKTKREHDNLHLHIIYSEREFIGEKVADRDVYSTDSGKRAQRASERAKNPDGTVKPPVIMKGQKLVDCSARKDEFFHIESWTRNMKERVSAEFERLGVELDKSKTYFNQTHEGNGKYSAIKHEYNKHVVALNADVGNLERQGYNVMQIVTDTRKAINKTKSKTWDKCVSSALSSRIRLIGIHLSLLKKKLSKLLESLEPKPEKAVDKSTEKPSIPVAPPEPLTPYEQKLKKEAKRYNVEYENLKPLVDQDIKLGLFTEQDVIIDGISYSDLKEYRNEINNLDKSPLNSPSIQSTLKDIEQGLGQTPEITKKER